MLEIVIALVLGFLAGIFMPSSLHKHKWVLDSTEKRSSFYLGNRENVYQIWKCADCCKVKIDVFSNRVNNV